MSILRIRHRVKSTLNTWNRWLEDTIRKRFDRSIDEEDKGRLSHWLIDVSTSHFKLIHAIDLFHVLFRSCTINILIPIKFIHLPAKITLHCLILLNKCKSWIHISTTLQTSKRSCDITFCYRNCFFFWEVISHRLHNNSKRNKTWFHYGRIWRNDHHCRSDISRCRLSFIDCYKRNRCWRRTSTLKCFELCVKASSHIFLI